MKIYKIEDSTVWIASFKGLYIVAGSRSQAIYWGLLNLVFKASNPNPLIKVHK